MLAQFTHNIIGIPLVFYVNWQSNLEPQIAPHTCIIKIIQQIQLNNSCQALHNYNCKSQQVTKDHLVYGHLRHLN